MLFPSALPTRVPDPGNNGCRSLYAAAACVQFRPVDDRPLPQRCKRIHCSIGQSRSCPGVRANIPSSILVAENGFQREESGGIRAVRRTIVVRKPGFSGPLPMSPALRPTWSRRAGWSAWGARSWPCRPSSRGQQRPAGLPSASAAGIRRSTPKADWPLLPGHPGFVPGERFIPHASGRSHGHHPRQMREARGPAVKRCCGIGLGLCQEGIPSGRRFGPDTDPCPISSSGAAPVRLPSEASRLPHSHQVGHPGIRMPPAGYCTHGRERLGCFP